MDATPNNSPILQELVNRMDQIVSETSKDTDDTKGLVNVFHWSRSKKSVKLI